tara:strand:- start:3759 stop:3932 length:174 start_codon:yes stop_codon:yes gene_type:complete
MTKIDAQTLKAFLDYSGCDLYFKAQPYITSGNHIEINSIDYSQLVEWLKDFNDKSEE